MQFEAIEPAQGNLATFSQPIKDTVAVNTMIIAHCQRGRVDKANAGALSLTGTQISDTNTVGFNSQSGCSAPTLEILPVNAPAHSLCSTP